MNKGGLLALVFVGILALSFVSAGVNVSITSYNSTKSLVSITDADTLYSYEVNFDYSGSSTVQQYNFLGSGSSATYGKTLKDGITSVYGSRLDATAQGITGAGNLFNISYSEALTLRYAFFIQNDTAGIYVYYNNTSSDTGNTGSSSGSSSGSSGGGGSGGGTSGTTYVYESDTLAKGIQKNLKEKDAIKLNLIGPNGESYIIRIISILNDSVIISIGTSENISLSYGTNRTISLNEDELGNVLVFAEKDGNGSTNVFIHEAGSSGSSSSSSGGYEVTTEKAKPSKSQNLSSSNSGGVGEFFSKVWSSITSFFRNIFK